MSKRLPQAIALALVSSFVLCQPALVAASTQSPTTLKSQPRASTAKLTDSNEQNLKAVSPGTTPRKNISYSKTRKASYLAHHKSTSKVRKLARHHVRLGNQEDCDACHNQCLIASLACIAISIASACPECGAICLAYQAGCQAICNTTTACKNLPLPVVNDN